MKVKSNDEIDTQSSIEVSVSHPSHIRSSRRRNEKVNAEASFLRAQIAAKQYEVQRRKKLLNGEACKVHVFDTSIGCSDKVYKDSDSISGESEELSKLKQRYMSLTGTTYGDHYHINRQSKVEIDRKRNFHAPRIDAGSSSAFMNVRSIERETPMKPHGNNMISNSLLVESGMGNLTSDTSGLYLRKYDQISRVSKPTHWCMKASSVLGEYFHSVLMITTFGVCFALSLAITQKIMLK